MLAAFAAAFMSTISTQLNWGASYLVNDFYRRFVHPRPGPTATM
jgi:solute:Na+ symporter, SSS family